MLVTIRRQIIFLLLYGISVQVAISQTGVSSVQLKAELAGHKGQVIALAISPDGKLIATGSKDKTVKLWDANTGKLTATLTGHKGKIYKVIFSPDGRTVASASDDKVPKLWDAQTGQLKASLSGHKGYIYTLEFSPESKSVLTASADNTAKLWDANTGEMKFSLLVHDKGDWADRFIRWGTVEDEGWIISQAYFSPDGKTILTISGDKTPKLWDTTTGKLRATLTHDQVTPLAAFSPDSQLVATESYDSMVRLWSVATGRLEATMYGHVSTIYDMKFSPDAKTLATGSRDATAILWDVKKKAIKARLTGYDARVPRIAFSPNGKLIAAKGGYKKHIVKIWDVENVQLKFTFPLLGRYDDVEEIAFNPNGEVLAVSSEKGVMLWDVITGELINTLEKAREPIAFNPNGYTVVTAGTDNKALLWEISR